MNFIRDLCGSAQQELSMLLSCVGKDQKVAAWHAERLLRIVKEIDIEVDKASRVSGVPYKEEA